MTTDAKRAIAITAVIRERGDDCQRAEMMFAGLSKEQMEQQHGASGKTRRQILEEYRMRKEEFDEVIAWLRGIK